MDAERAEQIQNQDHDQYGADDAAAADRAKARIAEAAARQEQNQKNDEEKRHETSEEATTNPERLRSNRVGPRGAPIKGPDNKARKLRRQHGKGSRP